MISPWKNFQQHIVHNVHHTAMILQLKALLHLLSLLYSMRINTVIQYILYFHPPTIFWDRNEEKAKELVITGAHTTGTMFEVKRFKNTENVENQSDLSTMVGVSLKY